jgi:hypothetical protein
VVIKQDFLTYSGFTPVEISTLLHDFLSHDGLQCEDKPGLLRALSIFQEKNKGLNPFIKPKSPLNHPYGG